MSTRTWELKIGNHVVRIKDKKDAAESFMHRVIYPVVRTAQYQREITGVHGGESNEWTSMLLFGGNSLANPEKHAADVSAFFAALPAVLTPSDYPAIKEHSSAIFKEHCPLIDNRETPEKLAEQTRRLDEAKAARESEAATFRAQYCVPNEIEIPAGQTAVILQLTFDDSDFRSDYHAPHRSIGCRMLLGFVSKGSPRAEMLARCILARYPDLNIFNWSWHTENYSGCNLRRIAWALGVPMTKAIERVMEHAVTTIDHGMVCAGCRDKSLCNECAFHQKKERRAA